MRENYFSELADVAVAPQTFVLQVLGSNLGRIT
jgi:hypothetical protein